MPHQMMILKRIPDDVHRQFKKAAAHLGISMQSLANASFDIVAEAILAGHPAVVTPKKIQAWLDHSGQDGDPAKS